MAVTTSFKQECPTCGAMVSIKENMAGKKVECTKCKDKFVAEKPGDEEEAKTKKKQGAANGKKSKPTDDEVDELEEGEDEDDEEEPVQVKPAKAKAKAGANGKTKKVADDEEDDEADSKKKPKKDGGSNKLTIGLGLAVVGVLVLGVAAFLFMNGRRSSDTVVRNPGNNVVPKPNPDDQSPVIPAEVRKAEPTAVPLNDAELARLSNLLPNDAEHVFHVYFRDLFQSSSSLSDAVFKTPGALDDVEAIRKLGFSLMGVDDLLRAERYSTPAWKYTVLHFKDLLKEGELKAALNLRVGGASIDGQTYYKIAEANPWFDTLARFSFGIPTARFLDNRKSDLATYLRIHNPQTVIIGDEAPIVALLKAKGQFPYLSVRTAAPPTPMPGNNAGAPSAPAGGAPAPAETPIKPGPGGVKPPGNKTGQRPLDRPDRFAPENPFFVSNAPEFTRLTFVETEQDQPPPAQLVPLKLPDTTFEGREPGSTSVRFVFAKDGVVTYTSQYLKANNVKGVWQMKPDNTVEITFPDFPGVAYQFGLFGKGQLAGVGKNALGVWKLTVDQLQGHMVGLPSTDPIPTPSPDLKNVDPNVPPSTTPSPAATLSRDDMYLTIKPSMKAIMDRVEARGADSQDKVLLSSTTDMDANIIVTKLPEFRDRVLRRPRQFWDITLMLNEPRPRIRTLGTSLLQRGDAPRFQLRNELTCAQEADAKEIKQEIVESTSYSIAQFLQKLLNHEVRLPAPLKEPKLAAKTQIPDGTMAPKKPPVANASQISVDQQSSTVDFRLDLVLDNAALAQIQGIVVLTAGVLRAEMQAATGKSPRHALAKAGKTVGEKGLSDREVPPGRFPPGAFLRAKTPFLVDQEPRSRISWMAGLLPYLGQQTLYNRLRFDQSWREPGNWFAGHTIVPQFIDPTYPESTRRVSLGELPIDFGATHYVGIAGVGMDAAAYKRGDPATAHKRGVLGYDGSASLEEVQQGRGVSSTILMIQVPHDGITGVSPWMAGGGATLRGVPEKNSIAPFVLSKDRNDKPIEHQGKRGTFVLMTDGSVRFVDQTIADDVFKAMCTINGPAPEGFNVDRNAATPLVPAPKEGNDPSPPADKTPNKKATDPIKTQSPAPVASGKLSVPGKFSVEAPPGYTWKKLQEFKVPTGGLATIYLADHPKSDVKITLTVVDDPPSMTDEVKRKELVAQFDAIPKLLKFQGLDVKPTTKPNLQSPIPARIGFAYEGTNDKKDPVAIVGEVVFLKNVYTFSVAAPNAADARALLAISQTLKE